MKNIQIFIPDRDGEGTWEYIDESQLDLTDHDYGLAEDIISFFQEYGIIDCSKCPLLDRCVNNCWEEILNRIGENKC